MTTAVVHCSAAGRPSANAPRGRRPPAGAATRPRPLRSGCLAVQASTRTIQVCAQFSNAWSPSYSVGVAARHRPQIWPAPSLSTPPKKHHPPYAVFFCPCRALQLEGAVVVAPERRRPKGIVHFLGGAFAGAVPQLLVGGCRRLRPTAPVAASTSAFSPLASPHRPYPPSSHHCCSTRCLWNGWQKEATPSCARPMPSLSGTSSAPTR